MSIKAVVVSNDTGDYRAEVKTLAEAELGDGDVTVVIDYSRRPGDGGPIACRLADVTA